MTVLRRLELRGFKSFASPTSFVFDQGITAIIGPNGSGKSNVAEALRWVLGEQQYSSLRSKRAEDIIFAGSEKRPKLGMAEVTLVIDNSGQALASPFSEVTITRRAFRTGDTEYLINGGRVRLRDIQQLAAPLGQAHTVIGQGLVDAVLSQRPEDRRGLFEHAAGIAGLRLRANQAERNLSEAAANAQRLHDILGELEPRVRSLERSARQAREYGQVRDQLRQLQRGYYGALWAGALARRERAETVLQEADLALLQVEQVRQQEGQRLAALRQEEQEAAGRSRLVERRIAEQERHLAETLHQAELAAAKLQALGQRREDLQSALTTAEQQVQEAEAEVRVLETDLEEVRLHHAERASEQARRQAEQAEQRQRQAREEDRRRRLDQELSQARRSLAEAEGRLAASRSEAERLVAERERLAGAAAERDEQASAVRLQLDTLAARRAALVEERGRLQRSLGHLETEARASEQAVLAAQEEIGRHERRRSNLQAELETLTQAYASGDGLFAGVRAVLRAVNRQELELPGLHGTLANLIETPVEYETAIETALGGQAQDLVVDRWADAERAIAFLKRTGAGRATFQPLDTVQAPPNRQIDVSDPRLIGRASELVGYPAEIEPVVRQVLGRVLVVSALEGARGIVGQSRQWTIVTLEGEVTRASGAVTGGAQARTNGLLQRERRRRTLPAEIARLDQVIDRLRADERERAELLVGLGEEISQLSRKLSDLDHRHGEVEGECARLSLTLEAEERAGTAVEDERSRLAQRESAIEAEVLALEDQRARLLSSITELEQEVGRLQTRREEPDQEALRLASLEVEVARTAERLRALDRERERLLAGIERARRERDERLASLDTLGSDLAAAEGARAAALDAGAALRDELARAQADLEPVAARRTTALDQIRDQEQAVDHLIGRVREAERERDRAALDLARARDEQVFLAERVSGDLEVEDPDSLLPDAGESGPRVEEEIRRLRERLRRYGLVGEDVVEEYERESERLRTMSEQLADVEQAAAALRSVLSDLRRTMAKQFDETFQEVAAEFQQVFRRLFGGGTATIRSQRDDDEESGGGIEIIAQPPGKRLQSLNQLSGGERALTAVALLMAIQRVNPSPFCLLDEVDAALDEANVLRFRQELSDLAGTTQAIVITHNRGTIEGADILYGVTMGDDGVSEVLSLRLDQVEHEPGEGPSALAGSRSADGFLAAEDLT